MCAAAVEGLGLAFFCLAAVLGRELGLGLTPEIGLGPGLEIVVVVVMEMGCVDDGCVEGARVDVDGWMEGEVDV